MPKTTVARIREESAMIEAQLNGAALMTIAHCKAGMNALRLSEIRKEISLSGFELRMTRRASLARSFGSQYSSSDGNFLLIANPEDGDREGSLIKMMDWSNLIGINFLIDVANRKCIKLPSDYGRMPSQSRASLILIGSFKSTLIRLILSLDHIVKNHF